MAAPAGINVATCPNTPILQQPLNQTQLTGRCGRGDQRLHALSKQPFLQTGKWHKHHHTELQLTG